MKNKINESQEKIRRNSMGRLSLQKDFGGIDLRDHEFITINREISSKINSSNVVDENDVNCMKSDDNGFAVIDLNYKV